MKNQWLFAILVIVFSISFSVAAKQEKFIKHTVLKGETITQISQKYKVTPYDIYRLNPDSQNGIKLNSVLLIPSSSSNSNDIASEKVVSNSIATSHVVQPKETLYSLSKKYNVSIEAIQNANGETLKNGLKIGQTIIIPVTEELNTSVPKITVAPKVVAIPIQPKLIEKPIAVSKVTSRYHIIQPKETKYSISKKYEVTIAELEQINPQIVAGFPIGFKLLLPGNSKNVATTISEQKVVEVPGNNVQPIPSTKKYYQEYLVKPKETVLSISSDFGITESELIALNPELKKGVKLGMILRVPKISEDEKKKP